MAIKKFKVHPKLVERRDGPHNYYSSIAHTSLVCPGQPRKMGCGRMWEGDQSEGVMVSLTVETLQASVVLFVFRLLGVDVKVLKPLGILVSAPLIST